MAGTAREPRRHADRRFAHGSATSGAQDHWKAKEVEEHLLAARAINDEPTQSEDKIVNEYKSLKKVHNKLTASTEILRQAIMQMREQSQVRVMGNSQSHVHEHKETEARIQE